MGEGVEPSIMELSKSKLSKQASSRVLCFTEYFLPVVWVTLQH
jgi:hypothetical protein